MARSARTLQPSGQQSRSGAGPARKQPVLPHPRGTKPRLFFTFCATVVVGQKNQMFSTACVSFRAVARVSTGPAVPVRTDVGGRCVSGLAGAASLACAGRAGECRAARAHHCHFSHHPPGRTHGGPSTGRRDDQNRLPQMVRGRSLAPPLLCLARWLMDLYRKIPPGIDRRAVQANFWISQGCCKGPARILRWGISRGRCVHSVSETGGWKWTYSVGR